MIALLAASIIAAAALLSYALATCSIDIVRALNRVADAVRSDRS